jgi:hypothetical protein
MDNAVTMDGVTDKTAPAPAGAPVDSPPPAPRSPVRHPGNTAAAAALSLLVTILGLILLAWLILFVTKGRFLKATFERTVSAATQRDVKVAGDFQLYLNPFNVKFLAEGMTISNPEWATRPNFFESKLIDTQIATWTLLFGDKRRINWLQMLNGNIDLEWDSKSRRNTWTFGDPNRPAEPLELPLIRAAIVQGSTVRYRDPRMQIEAAIRIHTVQARDTQFANTIRFSTATAPTRGSPVHAFGQSAVAQRDGGRRPQPAPARGGGGRDAPCAVRHAARRNGDRGRRSAHGRARPQYQPVVRFPRRRGARHANLSDRFGSDQGRWRVALHPAARRVRGKRYRRAPHHIDAEGSAETGCRARDALARHRRYRSVHRL